MAATAVTWPIAGLFKCNLSNIYAAFYTISTDSVYSLSLCVSGASCMKRETTDKRIVYARNTESG